MLLKLPAITFAAKIENDTCFRFLLRSRFNWMLEWKSQFLPAHSDLGIDFSLLSFWHYYQHDLANLLSWNVLWLCNSRVFQKRIWLTFFLRWPRFRFSTSHKVSCLFTFSLKKISTQKRGEFHFSQFGICQVRHHFPYFFDLFELKGFIFSSQKRGQSIPEIKGGRGGARTPPVTQNDPKTPPQHPPYKLLKYPSKRQMLHFHPYRRKKWPAPPWKYPREPPWEKSQFQVWLISSWWWEKTQIYPSGPLRSKKI